MKHKCERNKSNTLFLFINIVVKTRLQVIKKNQGETVYSGVGNAFLQIYKNEGMLAFFKGAGCRMMVIAPLFGIAQTVYYLGVAEKLLGIPRIVVGFRLLPKFCFNYTYSV